MNLTDLLDRTAFSLGELSISIGNLLLALLLTAGLIGMQRLLVRKVIPRFPNLGARSRRRLIRNINYSLLAILLLGLVLTTGLELTLETIIDQNNGDQPAPDLDANLSVSALVQSLLIWQIARLTVVLFGFLISGKRDRDKKNQQSPIGTYQRPREAHRRNLHTNFVGFIYSLAVQLIINLLQINFTLFEVPIQDKPNVLVRLGDVIYVVLVFWISRLLIWFSIEFFLRRFYENQRINQGSRYAINQLFQYVIYFIALLIMLRIVGVDITLIAGGAAALLLGVGIGLQQTFNDFFSGILLLFERSVEVGDVVEIGDLVGRVQRIGLRTSLVLTRDNRTVIVPNSNLVISQVNNWSHNDEIARFYVNVGVAYGSDTELVRRLLLEAIEDDDKILKFPRPFVRFVNFGNSSLDFEVHFYSRELMRILDVQSDVRFKIDRLFRENEVTIPFPQRDVWIKQK